MASKWNQDLEKESPELIWDDMESSANKCAKKSRGSLRDGPVNPESQAWVPLIKGKHKP